MGKQVTYIDPPETCNICGDKFLDGVMYDCKTVHGPWANLCSNCYKIYGVGLGTGLGQKYQRDLSGKYIKVEG